MKDWEMNGVEVHDMKFPKIQIIDSQAIIWEALLWEDHFYRKDNMD